MFRGRTTGEATGVKGKLGSRNHGEIKGKGIKGACQVQTHDWPAPLSHASPLSLTTAISDCLLHGHALKGCMCDTCQLQSGQTSSRIRALSTDLGVGPGVSGPQGSRCQQVAENVGPWHPSFLRLGWQKLFCVP